MNEIVKYKFKARWSEIDFNKHMTNTAYLNTSSNIRFLFFEEHGFTSLEMEKLMVGPVIMKDEIEYYREIKLSENYEVHYILAGLSEDGSRWRIHTIFYKADGKKAAVVTSLGGWMDLRKRCLVAPPDKFWSVIDKITRSDDFEVLPCSAK
jgi:acyl-CoA thioester hydrolase